MNISAIMCLNHNNAIGWKETNKLVFYIADELKLFKKITTASDSGKQNIVVMGRNTWKSINQKPLPNRLNCVISSKYKQLNYKYKKYDNFLAFENVESFLLFTDETETIDRYETAFVIGGVSLYEIFISNGLVSTIYCTQVTTPNNRGDIIMNIKNKLLDDYNLECIYRYKNKNAIDTLTSENLTIDYDFCIYKKKVPESESE